MTKLLVENLWSSATEQQLREAFERHGEICQVALVLDRRTGKPRCFTYVTYAQREQAHEAVGRMHRSICFGQRITVRLAVERGGEQEKGDKGSSRVRTRDSGGRQEGDGETEKNDQDFVPEGALECTNCPTNK